LRRFSVGRVPAHKTRGERNKNGGKELLGHKKKNERQIVGEKGGEKTPKRTYH